MAVRSRTYAYALCVVILASTHARGDTILYTSSPGSYPAVTSALSSEFGTTAFPPLAETAQSYYEVLGTGPVTLTFRFKADTGSFLFNFGYYRVTPALDAIDTSTTTGKIDYALMALAPGNATLVFDDAVDDPGAVATATATGGETLGFFLIPDASLAAFQADPSTFAILGFGSDTLGVPGADRWPFFGLAAANPAGLDQLMSFGGISAVTGGPTNLFAWEDLTRATIPGNPIPTDSAFNDLIFAVEGVAPAGLAPAVPEPGSLALFGAGLAAAGLARRRRAR